MSKPWALDPSKRMGYVFLSPEQHMMVAFNICEQKWGIKNPPLWLLCHLTGRTYRLPI